MHHLQQNYEFNILFLLAHNDDYLDSSFDKMLENCFASYSFGLTLLGKALLYLEAFSAKINFCLKCSKWPF
jgi:hypothetical protein